jgi:hypothetical protein
MIAWGLFLAWSGQKYNAKKKLLAFRNDLDNSTLPWFTGASWGTATLIDDYVKIEILEGHAEIERVEFRGVLYNKYVAEKPDESASTIYFRR